MLVFHELGYIEGARALQTLLGHCEWRNFLLVIVKAKVAFQNAGPSFGVLLTSKNDRLCQWASRKINDLALTRHACHLITQSGDPRKDAIAFAMTYFVVQARELKSLN